MMEPWAAYPLGTTLHDTGAEGRQVVVVHVLEGISYHIISYLTGYLPYHIRIMVRVRVRMGLKGYVGVKVIAGVVLPVLHAVGNEVLAARSDLDLSMRTCIRPKI